MKNKLKKVLFNKKKQVIGKVDVLSDKEQFYKMLLKFEKRHPEFNATSMMLKLYPSIDCNQFKSI